MTKVSNAGAAPVSKYASKYAAKRTSFAKASEEASNDSSLPQVEDGNAKVETEAVQSKLKTKKKELPSVTSNYPEHVVQIALLIKNNAEIRRFTALGILNYLLQKGEIKGDKRYVSFKWNKFAVKCNGLMREFSYNEPFFLNALVAAFSSFSASAQRTIDIFCRKEMSVDIVKAVDKEEVEHIVSLNEEYQGYDVTDDSND